MQQRLVLLVADGAEDCGFTVRGIGQHGQGLVAVGGNDHVIVIVLRAVAEGKRHPVGAAFDAQDRAFQTNPVFEPPGQGGDVLSGAAFDGAPLRLVADIQNP